MARGDLLLFRGDNTLSARAICWATKGPMSHVEVDLGDGTSIGAHTAGIEHWQTPVDTRDILLVPISTRTTPPAIERGVTWLTKQLGHSYGWEDIFDQFFVLLKLGGVFLGVRDRYDCSDLVAQYILRVLPLGVLDLGPEPHLVTPNDIYRASIDAGLLPKG